MYRVIMGKVIIVFLVACMMIPHLEKAGYSVGSFNWWTNSILYGTFALVGLDLAYGRKP